MITRFSNLIGRLAVIFVMLSTIAACGGGGSDAGFNPDDGSEETYFIALRLLDQDGLVTSTVTLNSPGTLEARVTRKNKNGKVIPDAVVEASVTLGALFPASGSQLTNSEGIATFQIEAGVEKGGSTATVSVESPTGTVTESLSYQIGVSGLRLGYFDENGLFMENEIGVSPSSTLSAQGQAQLTVAIVDENGDRIASAETVRFISDCLSTGKATLSPTSPIATVTGEVTTTYTASRCSGDDEIVAKLAGGSAEAFATLSIAAATANRLAFVSAEPDIIVLRGTGGGPNRQEFSDVVFQTVGADNAPLQGIKVDFSLTTFVGGLTVSPTSAISDADGNVKVSVFSGDVPTVVRVIASTSAGDGTGEISTVSDVLSVSTGLPDQNSISLSVSSGSAPGGFVVENGMITDDVDRIITVSMADKFNNPVPDGTAAIFTTEYGAIDPSCTTGLTNGDRYGDRIGTNPPETGQCSVLWTSGEPRTPTLDEVTASIITINGGPGYNCPSHNESFGPCPDDLGFTRGGRSTILVAAIGEESFIDRNGNGIMDEDEKDLFTNVPEAHLDNNEDGIYNPDAPGCKGVSVEDATGACLAGFEEVFSDFNSNGAYDRNDSPAQYNGLLCPEEGDGVWCSRELVNVRDDTVLILSAAPEWGIALFRNGNFQSSVSEGSVYEGYVSDLFNSIPPAGSRIRVTAEGDCTVVSPALFEIPDTPIPGAFEFYVEVDGEGGSGSLNVTLSPFEGTEYTQSYSCFTIPTPEPPDPNDLVVGGGSP